MSDTVESKSFEIELQSGTTVTRATDSAATEIESRSTSVEQTEVVATTLDPQAEHDNQPTVETETLADFQLTRDRSRREIRRPSRFDDSDFVGYAFNCFTDM
ncbi:MAG: hypothetical protein Q8754_03015 [Sweet potato little leaf phytoplasma]|nr:hypothetical protein [Sweet potato little leaf phytoplasma]